MKAITLWQPHAQAIALGIKPYETRSFAIKHRGPMAICSAQKKFRFQDYPEPYFREAWKRLHDAGLNGDGLQYGMILAVVDVVNCIKTDAIVDELPDGHKFWGDFGIGRYAWKLENVRPLWPPMPVRGRQLFFDVPAPTCFKLIQQK